MILKNVLNKTNSLGIAMQIYNLFFCLSKLLAKTLVPSCMEPFAEWEPMPVYVKRIADSASSDPDFGLRSSAAIAL